MSTDTIPKYLLIVLLIFLFEVLSISKNKTCAQEENHTLNAQLLLDSSETYWYTFPDSAIYLSEKAINCFDTTKHKEMLSRAYSSFGTSYYIKGDYGKSLAYYFKALNINTVLSDSIGIAITLNNIGNIYMVEGKLTEANELFLSALDIKNILKDNKSVGHTLLSISNLYYLEGNYADALDYALNALEKYRIHGNRDEMAPVFTSLGIICNNINKLDEALKYLDSALVISKQTKDHQNECIILLNIGTIHIQSGSIRKGITFFENSLFLAQEIDYLLGFSKSFEKLGDAYEKLSMHNEALLYHKLFIDMRDSLLRIENIEATIKKNLKYAFQKERDLTNLEQHKIDIVTKENEKRKNLILIITLILFFPWWL